MSTRTIAITLAGLVLASSASLAQTATAPKSGTAAVVPYLNGLPAAERLAVMEREAKREGRVVVYGALGTDLADGVLEPFRTKYPEIRLDFVRLRESELVERAALEARAQRTSGDIAISNVPWLELLKGNLDNYVPTTWADYKPSFRFGGDKEKWSALVYQVLPSVIAWRTDRVKPEDAPKSLDDLVQAKWKSRLGTTSNMESLIDGLEADLGKDGTQKLIDGLAAQNNRLYPSQAALSDGLSVGEVDAVWNIGTQRPISLKSAGAPIDYAFPKPLFGLGLTVSVLAGAPNTYAAALLMESISQASTQESADNGKMKGATVLGNTKGSYTLKLEALPPLTLYQSIDQARFGQLSRLAERKFLRR